jgi:hypothetical protein
VFVKAGKNDLVIEIATTLERERSGDQTWFTGSPTSSSGITGEVTLWNHPNYNL